MNYSGAARSSQISVTSVLRFIDDIIDFSFIWNKPIKRIGMDGKGVSKRKQIFNITNLEDNEVIGVFPNLSQEKLRTELLKVDFKLRMAVEEVCIDMDTFFVVIIKECFPNAKIVLDHFHVIQWAVHLLKEEKNVFQDINNESYRINQLLMIPTHKLKPEQFKKLEEVFKKVPKLKKDWKTIHQLRRVYWQKDREAGKKQLEYVISLCKKSDSKYIYKDLVGTLTRWFDEILNYYLSETTNAYTEGVHTRFELLKRGHFGIKNIERFCKRLLFFMMPIEIFLNLLAQGC